MQYQKNKSMNKIFKYTAILEGFSYLALLSNMLFIKPNNTDLYKSLLFPVGMTHGILFIGYVIFSILINSPCGLIAKSFFTG